MSFAAFRARFARSRIGRRGEAALLRLFGRPLRCADCGRVLLVGIPIILGGRLRIFGARESHVRVAFSGKDRLEFRHAELDQCPSPDRPWVS